jgi:hypothetical protein
LKQVITVVKTYSENATYIVVPTPEVDQPVSQVVCNGQNTSPINFTGDSASYFTWTNNNTTIGLAGSGTGNIPSFVAINTGTTPVDCNDNRYSPVYFQ